MRFAVLAAGISALWAQPASASLFISISGSGYGYITRVPEPFRGPRVTTFFSDIVFDPSKAVPYANGLLYTHQDTEDRVHLTTLSVFVQNDRLEVRGEETNSIYGYDGPFSFNLQFAPGYLSSAFPTRFDPEMFVSGTFSGRSYVGSDGGAWDVLYGYGSINEVVIGVGFEQVPYDPVWSRTFIYPVDLAVPEPATWAMMLSGFAVLGAGLRRRKPTVRYSFS